MPIQGFRDRRLAAVFDRMIPKGFPSDLARIVRRKLVMMDTAAKLTDLRLPPANRLEALKGDRAGLHSIRVNDQFRICFRWTVDGPDEVDLVDYH